MTGARLIRLLQRRPTPFLARSFSFGRVSTAVEAPDWSKKELKALNKATFINPSENVPTPEQIESYQKEHQISVSENAPPPILSLEIDIFAKFFGRVLNKQGFKEPTPIQAQGWSLGFSGQDFIGIAQTGSGKTLSFLFPGLLHIKSQSQRRSRQPKGLVIAPTRELCNQIYQTALPYCKAMNLRTTPVYGGVGRHAQIRELRRGVDLLIATPGRLLDLLHEGHFHLEDTSYVVLDEADRCLDMGFEPQIREIMKFTRPDRQTVMFSATWPKEIQGLASEFLSQDYEKLVIGSTTLTANKAIQQELVVVQNDQERLEIMINELKELENGQAIIFCASKHRVDVLGETLKEHKIRVATLHGDKSQAARENVLRLLKQGRVKAVVATDVAARGLDVNNIKLVVNCDLPRDIESYIHRIGRTGRQSKQGQQEGRAISFCSINVDKGLLPELKRVFVEAGQEENLPTEIKSIVEQTQQKNKFGFGSGGGKRVNERFGRSKPKYRPSGRGRW